MGIGLSLSLHLGRGGEVEHVPEPPAFRSASTKAGTSVGFAITYPAGWQAGDLLFCAAGLATTSTITTPDGWTLIRRTQVDTNQRVLATFYRIAESGDSGSTTFLTTGGGQHAAVMAAYTGVDPTNPLDDEDGQSNASSANCVAPSITTTGPNRLLVFAGAAGNRTFTEPDGYDERGEIIGATTVSCEVADTIHGNGGATGTATAVLSAAIANGGHLAAFRGI